MMKKLLLAFAIFLISFPTLATQKTPAQIKTEINAQITTNGQGAITGSVLNGILQDITDSYADRSCTQFSALTGVVVTTSGNCVTFLSALNLPLPTTTTLGAVYAKTCAASQWINALGDGTGVFGCTQPAFSNLSGQATLAQLPSIAAYSVLGNSTGSSAVPQALTTLPAALTIPSPDLTGNPFISGGVFRDLYTTPPTNEMFFGTSFSLSYCDILGCTAGDHTRASAYWTATTQHDASKAEYHFQVDTTSNTGYAPQWQTSHAYASGNQVDNNGEIYQETVATCVSASSGSGPSGTSSPQTDGTCSWDYVTPNINNGKVGLANAFVVGANSGHAWGIATSMSVQQNVYQGMFVASQEIDIGLNNANQDCVIGIANCYDLYMSGTTSGPITAYIGISGSSVGTGAYAYAAHYGILANANANFIKDAFINDGTDAVAGMIFYGAHGGADFDTTHQTSSTTPFFAKMAAGQVISFNNGDANFAYVGSHVLQYKENGGQIVVAFNGASTTAPNYLNILNAPTGFGPILQAVGGDTDIPLNLQAKGAGIVAVQSSFQSNGSSFNVPSASGGASTKYICSDASNNWFAQTALCASVAASDLSNGTTGSGAVVLATSPSLTTPTIGAATATSVNKVAITAPATGSTLSLADGSTLATSGAFSTTLTATATTVATLPAGTHSLAPLDSPSFTTPALGDASATSLALGTAGTAPTAGKLGEEIESSVPIGSAVAFTSTVTGNVTSVALTAGNWLCYGNVITAPAAGTTSTHLSTAITDVSATMPTAPNDGSYFDHTFALGAGVTTAETSGQRIFRSASPITVYLVANVTFASSTMGLYGYLGCLRQP